MLLQIEQAHVPVPLRHSVKEPSVIVPLPSALSKIVALLILPRGRRLIVAEGRYVRRIEVICECVEESTNISVFARLFRGRPTSPGVPVTIGVAEEPALRGVGGRGALGEGIKNRTDVPLLGRVRARRADRL
jgi:hypothetical protein